MANSGRLNGHLDQPRAEQGSDSRAPRVWPRLIINETQRSQIGTWPDTWWYSLRSGEPMARRHKRMASLQLWRCLACGHRNFKWLPSALPRLAFDCGSARRHDPYAFINSTDRDSIGRPTHPQIMDGLSVDKSAGAGPRPTEYGVRSEWLAIIRLSRSRPSKAPASAQLPTQIASLKWVPNSALFPPCCYHPWHSES